MKKLVILLPSAQTKIARMRRRVKNRKAKKISKVTNHTRTKVRKLTLWLRILIIMKMK